MQVSSRPYMGPRPQPVSQASVMQAAPRAAKTSGGAPVATGGSAWLNRTNAWLTGAYYRAKDAVQHLIPGGPKAPTQTTVPVTADTVAELHDSRTSWFMSQTHGVYNSNEDTWGNSNCGPTSLAMIAKAFGKISPGPEGVDAAIEDARRRMGQSQNERDYTSTTGLVKGAQSYGLSAAAKHADSLATIQSELNANRLVIASVVPKYLSPLSIGGGHFTVVTAIKDGKVYLNDPWRNNGPMVVDAKVFEDALKSRTGTIVSIGK